jgi:hypothetical protein
MILDWAASEKMENGIPGRVESIRRHGPVSLWTIGLGEGGRLVGAYAGGDDALLNRQVFLNLPPSLLWVFPE